MDENSFFILISVLIMTIIICSLLYPALGILVIIMGIITFYLLIFIIAAIANEIEKRKITIKKEHRLIIVIGGILIITLVAGLLNPYKMESTAQPTTTKIDPDVTVSIDFPKDWYGVVNDETVDGSGNRIIYVGKASTIGFVRVLIYNSAICNGDGNSAKIPITVTIKKGDQIIKKNSSKGNVYVEANIPQ